MRDVLNYVKVMETLSVECLLKHTDIVLGYGKVSIVSADYLHRQTPE